MNENKRNQKPVCFAFYSFAVLTLIMLVGCSSGGGVTSPSSIMGKTPMNPEDIQSGVIPIAVFDLIISSDLSQAEIVPSRDADVYGDSWFSVLTNFFKVSPCRDCLTIKGVSIDSDNNVVLSIYARHPFKKGDPSQPPTAKNRDDIRVFDTKLIVVTKDDAGPSFDDFGARLSSSIVANADGYTDMIDPVYDLLNKKDDNTHPYIILFENPNEGNVDPSSATGFTDLANASGHNVMNQDTESLNDLVLKIQSGKTHQFKLYLTANYGQSAENYLQRLTPRYYLPEFNAKEAWKVEACVESNSLGPTYTQSMAEVLVKIWDWQHDAKLDPGLTTLDSIRAPSDIKSVDIMVPGLFSGVVSETMRDPIGNGKGDTPLEYHLEVYNNLGASAGDFAGLVRVVDERHPGGNQTMTQDGIDNNGFDLAPFDIPGFRTYDYIEFPIVVFWNVSPVARFTLSPGNEPLYIGRDEEFNYDASSSYDVDGLISSYEWDFDYDRVTFEPEAGHDSATGTYKYSTAGIHRIALRVKDNTIPIMSDITYKYITVLPETQNIDPRMICAWDFRCNNLKLPAKRAIKTHENFVHVVLGGLPFGERYIITSDDYGAHFGIPVKVTSGLTTSATQHIGGFDISSTGRLGYVYFDENAAEESAWFILNHSNDGSSWGPPEILSYSTEKNYVDDCALIYGVNDREFIIFSMLDKSGSFDTSTMFYIHRASEVDLFQAPPIPLVYYGSPPDQLQFYQPNAGIGYDGQIHVVYPIMLKVGSEQRYSLCYGRIAADGSDVTQEPIKISQIGTFDARKDFDLAVDGQNVYVAYIEWDRMSQTEDLMFVASDDNGETWSSPHVKITDMEIHQIANDHPVSMAVDDNHRIHVVWAHNKNQIIPEFRDILYDYSDDGGHTWHTDRMIYGDSVDGDQSYPSLTLDEIGRVHLIWWNADEAAGKGVWHTRFRG